MRSASGTGVGSLPSPAVHRPRGVPRPSRRGLWRAASLILVHLLVLAHLAHWRVAGRTLTPLEPSEAMQTFELGLVNAGFVLLVVSVLATLVLGRFFCGWACHVVAYQDLCAWLLGRIGLRPRPVRSRLLAFVPLGAAFYMFAWPSLARILAGGPAPVLEAHFTTDGFWDTFPGPWIAALTLLVDGFLLVWLLGAKGFCTYGCPYGGLFGLVERAAPLRIRVTDACSGCGQCTAVCTSNVRVHEEVARHRMVVDPGCMKCMDCVSSCPTEALYLGFGKLPGRSRRPRRTYDFRLGEELALLALFLVALYAFRDLYRKVPFLLAIGLSVMAAVLLLATWRTLRSGEMRLQSLSLRAAGSWRPAGLGLVVLGLLTIASTAHSAWVQYHTREGERLLRAAHLTEPSARTELVERSRAHLSQARAWGLLPVGTLELELGTCESALGRRSRAEEHFRRALAIDPGLRSPRLALADLLILRGERLEAERLLRELLALDPESREAAQRLERLGVEAPR